MKPAAPSPAHKSAASAIDKACLTARVQAEETDASIRNPMPTITRNDQKMIARRPVFTRHGVQPVQRRVERMFRTSDDAGEMKYSLAFKASSLVTENSLDAPLNGLDTVPRENCRRCRSSLGRSAVMVGIGF